MKNVINIVLFLSLALSGCTNSNNVFVDSLNPEIEYWGRIDTSNTEYAELYWSGTTIKLNFEGKSIHAVLADETGDNYYNIIIDNDRLSVLRPNTSKQHYLLASGLAEGKHTVEIFKRTEWDRGKTLFYGFQIDSEGKLLPKSEAKKRKIEFYGNSITAGYAVEDTSGMDSPDSTFTNNYLSYSAITARHFDAEYQCICKSGIGIMVSWFPLIMPELFNRKIPSEPNSQWDFNNYNPDVVVINLFQNDSWIVNMPEREEYKLRFSEKGPNEAYIVNAYEQFVIGIRAHYPEAKIICALGSMDVTAEGSKWPGYIKQAVLNINDNNIYTHFMPYKETPGHPSIKEQREIANSLIQFIDANIEW